MKFPNAAKGISKIFTAEILQLIGTLATGIAVVLTAIFRNELSAENLNAGMTVWAIIILALMAGAAVVGIIALIIKIIGFIQTARDESFFRGVIYLTVIAILICFVAGAFSWNPFWSGFANAVADVVTFITSLMVVLGISRMAIALKDDGVLKSSGTLFKVILGVGILSVLTSFFSIFIPSAAGYYFTVVLGCMTIVLSLVRYVLYLIVLSKAKKMLKSNVTE